MPFQTYRGGDDLMAEVSTSPHGFKPLRPWDMRPGGRCRHCLLPCNAHPIHYWAPSRPLGDKRKAELSFEALSGRSADA